MSMPASVTSAVTNVSFGVNSSPPLLIYPRQTSLSRFNFQKKNIVLLNDVFNGLQIKSPLVLNIELEDNLFIVSDDVFNVYGDGYTFENARKDYLESLVDYYHLLEKSSQERKEDEYQFEILCQYLTKK